MRLTIFNKESKSYHFKIEKYINEVELNITEQYSSIAKQVQMIQLTKEDLAILKQLQPHIDSYIPTMVDKFYSALSLNQNLLNLINNYSQVERLKITLTRHLKEMFDGHINSDYIESRNRIAITHVRIGLESDWYLTSFQSFFTSFNQFLLDFNLSREDTILAINAFSKILNLEKQMVIKAYDLEQERIRSELNNIKSSMLSTVQNIVGKLNTMNQDTTNSLHLISNQSENIKSATSQGLGLVQNTENQSNDGKKTIRNTNNFNE